MESGTSYRPLYHLSPPQGRLNDPNGLFLIGDMLHVYYQHDPGFPEAPKRTGWAHAVGQVPLKLHVGVDGVWDHKPNALYPDMPYDKHGCYSGGAVVHEGVYYLYYTGNLKEDTPLGVERIPSQNLVIAEQPYHASGGYYRRFSSNPLIQGSPEGYTGHYRDPQISPISPQPRRDNSQPGHKGGEDSDSLYSWRMVLGAQAEGQGADEDSGRGTIVLYQSRDLLNWDFSGEIQFDLTKAQKGYSPDLIPEGYMWECPNLLRLRDQVTGEEKDILIFCPQGLETQKDSTGALHYASTDQCGYIVGILEGTTFHVERGFSELDYGQEFYAPQICLPSQETTSCSDYALLMGWMGLPAADDHPTVEEEGWVHCLTVPRKISLHQGELHQEFFLESDQWTTTVHDKEAVPPREELSSSLGLYESSLGTIPTTLSLLPEGDQLELQQADVEIRWSGWNNSNNSSAESRQNQEDIDSSQGYIHEGLIHVHRHGRYGQGDMRTVRILSSKKEDIPIQILADRSAVEIMVDNRYSFALRSFSAKRTEQNKLVVDYRIVDYRD